MTKKLQIARSEKYYYEAVEAYDNGDYFKTARKACLAFLSYGCFDRIEKKKIVGLWGRALMRLGLYEESRRVLTEALRYEEKNQDTFIQLAAIETLLRNIESRADRFEHLSRIKKKKNEFSKPSLLEDEDEEDKERKNKCEMGIFLDLTESNDPIIELKNAGLTQERADTIMKKALDIEDEEDDEQHEENIEYDDEEYDNEEEVNTSIEYKTNMVELFVASVMCADSSVSTKHFRKQFNKISGLFAFTREDYFKAEHLFYKSVLNDEDYIDRSIYVWLYLTEIICAKMRGDFYQRGKSYSLLKEELYKSSNVLAAVSIASIMDTALVIDKELDIEELKKLILVNPIPIDTEFIYLYMPACINLGLQKKAEEGLKIYLQEGWLKRTVDEKLEHCKAVIKYNRLTDEGYSEGIKDLVAFNKIANNFSINYELYYLFKEYKNTNPNKIMKVDPFTKIPLFVFDRIDEYLEYTKTLNDNEFKEIVANSLYSNLFLKIKFHTKYYILAQYEEYYGITYVMRVAKVCEKKALEELFEILQTADYSTEEPEAILDILMRRSEFNGMVNICNNGDKMIINRIHYPFTFYYCNNVEKEYFYKLLLFVLTNLSDRTTKLCENFELLCRYDFMKYLSKFDEKDHTIILIALLLYKKDIKAIASTCEYTEEELFKFRVDFKKWLQEYKL